MLRNLREKISGNEILCSAIKRVIVLDKIDSTNSYAQSLDRPADSTVVIASSQTKGRGRDNREWKSFAEKNISMSIILDYPKDKDNLGLISILSANSLVEALEELNIKSQVKWPNDVLVGAKKISGILSEASFKNNVARSIIVGVGINVNCTSDDFHKDDYKYRLEPTSILLESGNVTQREDLIVSFLSFYFKWTKEFKIRNYNKILDFWKSRWDDSGKEISIVSNGKKISGTMSDVNKNGELVLDVGGQMKVVNSGEILV
ncbi:biotin--[acetyl-CoA-carboxylase] ligase [bacterium]|mgnify:FL=1|nr:biotin--[acetyl-CoA-carboxylase] ligase [bacterium]MBT3795868.1 biotin--[acetyl-CoA-carboxylase] ligase [bacterium]MBT4634334.1 biotin--[acetyl-CoA-carboxylase] ligase [bacterium]